MSNQKSHVYTVKWNFYCNLSDFPGDCYMFLFSENGSVLSTAFSRHLFFLTIYREHLGPSFETLYSGSLSLVLKLNICCMCILNQILEASIYLSTFTYLFISLQWFPVYIRKWTWAYGSQNPLVLILETTKLIFWTAKTALFQMPMLRNSGMVLKKFQVCWVFCLFYYFC